MNTTYIFKGKKIEAIWLNYMSKTPKYVQKNQQKIFKKAKRR